MPFEQYDQEIAGLLSEAIDNETRQRKLIALIKINIEYAKRIFSQPVVWMPSQLDPLFSWALNNLRDCYQRQEQTSAAYEHSKYLVEQICEKALPITKSEHAAWLIDLIKTNRESGMHVFQLIPKIQLLFSGKQADDLFNWALNNGDGDWLKLILRKNLPINTNAYADIINLIHNYRVLDTTINTGILELTLKNPTINWTVVHLYAKYQTLDEGIQYTMLEALIKSGPIEILEAAVTAKSMPKARLQKLLLKDDHALFFLKPHNSQALNNFFVAHYSPENRLKLLTYRNETVHLKKLQSLIQNEPNAYLEQVADQNLTAETQSLLLLYAATNTPLPNLNDKAQKFIAQLNWSTFAVEAIPLSEQEFDFLNDKGIMPAENYIEYLYTQLKKSDTSNNYRTALKSYIHQAHVYVPFLKYVNEQLTAKNLDKLLACDNKGKAKTQLGQFIAENICGTRPGIVLSLPVVQRSIQEKIEATQHTPGSPPAPLSAQLPPNFSHKESKAITVS